jgi:isopenicillin-N epimerase
VKSLFLLDPDLVFLNHGYFGACPAEVLEAQFAWQRAMEANPVAFLARRSAELLARSRAALAAALGADPAHLVFLPNATTAVNTVARSLDLREGDEVLATDHEYGACDHAWAFALRGTGARIVRTAIPLPFQAGTFEDRVWSRVTARTRFLFLSHVTSTTALRLPLAGLCARARERGILTFVDGAHVPGHFPLDLGALGADFYAGNCHKWLCAPKGSAFLHVRPEHHAALEALVVSWGYGEAVEGHTGTASYTGGTLLERRLQWQGTRDLSAFLAVPAALDFQARHGWDGVRRACHALARTTLERVCALTGLDPVCADGDYGQMVAIPFPAPDPEALRERLLGDFRIEVPVTTHRDRAFVRLSLQGYNTAADADALVAALGAVLAGGARP